jgi:hypothetical protein
MLSRRHSWLFLILLFFALMGGILYFDSKAQGAGIFNDTKFEVGANFKPFYDSIEDHTLVFGFPISNEINDPVSNKLVQYFQRARFELEQDEISGATTVVVTPLGELLLESNRLRSAEEHLPLGTAACEAIKNPNTGQVFHICYDFQKFFKAHGGIARFGYPISAFSREGDIYVQYFEKAKFEWRPGNKAEMVQLADLGTQYYEERAQLIPGRSGVGEKEEFKTFAFVSRPSASAGTEQTLYVVAQVYDESSQTWVAVPGAEVVVTMLAPNLHKPSARFTKTDLDGISVGKVLISDNLPANSLVQIKVEVTYNGYSQTAITWFRIWW